MLKSIVLSAVLLISGFANAQEGSKSDAFCRDLISRGESLPDPLEVADLMGDSKAKIAQLDEIFTVLAGIQAYSEKAIDKKMSYREFMDFSQKDGVKIPPRYEKAYITSYVTKHCGRTITEAAHKISSDKMVSTDSRIRFEKQFDPTSHSYYKELSKDAKDKGAVK